MTTGIGNYIGDPFRGNLVFDYLPDDLANAEFSIHEADCRDERPCFTRSASESERTLLAHLGFTLPGDLLCHVDKQTAGIHLRRFPAIEDQINDDGSLPS